jgi:hypothetical protein
VLGMYTENPYAHNMFPRFNWELTQQINHHVNSKQTI